jgi:hypothetical protein
MSLKSTVWWRADRFGRVSIEKVAKSPPATGLLVTMVIEGMPARVAGIRPADVIIAYGESPTPDRVSLERAIEGTDQSGTAALEIVRAGKARILKVEPGRLGVQTVAVREGEPIEARPPAKKVTFDFSRLAQPLELWATFHLAKRRVGFEHHVYRRRGSSLLLDYEVAFDGGKHWGLNHFVVHLVLGVDGARPEARSVRYENPIAGWVTDGHLERKGSRRIWESRIRGPSGSEHNSVAVPAEVLPSYAVATLPLFLVPEPGACLHYTPLNEGLGVAAPPAGLLCAGKKSVTIASKRVQAWRWESHSFGEHLGTTVVGPNGEPMRIDYGGPHAQPATRDEALKGLHQNLVPRTG